MTQRDPDIDLRIWQVIALIPAGKVATYGDIARLAGLPGAARRVGYTLRHLPNKTRIPWHRVINAQGRISLPQNSVSGRLQRERLEEEGVFFRPNHKLDINKYRWKP